MRTDESVPLGDVCNVSNEGEALNTVLLYESQPPSLYGAVLRHAVTAGVEFSNSSRFLQPFVEH